MLALATHKYAIEVGDREVASAKDAGRRPQLLSRTEPADHLTRISTLLIRRNPSRQPCTRPGRRSGAADLL